MPTCEWVSVSVSGSVSGFGFRVSGFGFRGSGLEFRASDFGFRVSGVGLWGYVVQVVVLAAGADTLLGVGRALELGERGVRVDGAHEDGLELVHARVVEEERGVVERHDAARGVVRVPAIASDLLLRLEELEECGAHFRRRPLEGHARCSAKGDSR